MHARVSVLLAASLTLAASGPAAKKAAPPSVILNVIVDDLGWSNVGWHSANLPESATPRLTALAAAGTTLERRYTHYTCTPSRSAFTTGRLPVHVQLTLDNPDVANAGIPVNMTSLPLKLREAGWYSAMVGKWDQGCARHEHTPEGRGYDSSLVYFTHMNDYFSQSILPTGLAASCNLSIVDLWSNGAPAAELAGTGYIEDLFLARALATVAAHNFSAQPLFLDYRPHCCHWPLMVPAAAYLNASGVVDDEGACGYRFYGRSIWPGGPAAAFSCRRQYEAMLALADAKVGAIVDALAARGVWDETVVLFQSDNGGSSSLSENAANNWPLRGGKYSPWEGGVRVPSFVSGGYLPPAARGAVSHALISVADGYLTLCKLAGLPEAACLADPLASAGGLPPIDSLDFWPVIVGSASSLRTELPIDASTLLVLANASSPSAPWWKLHTGTVRGAGWMAPVFPNATSPDPSTPSLDCAPTGGCLFDVLADPSETRNVAAQHPQVLADMHARLATLAAGFFSNSDVGVDACPPGTPGDCACYQATHRWGGFLGPWQLS